jgi:hypothetical protein
VESVGATGVTAEIRPLHGVAAIPTREGVKDVREAICRLVREHRRGEISGLAVAVIRPNRDYEIGWASGCASHTTMVAATARLAYRVNAATDGD